MTAMLTSSRGPLYKNLDVHVDGLGSFSINYVEDGPSDASNVLLLHSFPSDSSQFREFIPLLSHKYHVFAPDLPGFGLTTSPKDMTYSFENLTAAIEAWLAALEISSYAVYVFGYGAAVCFRLAMKHPEQLKAIITQNGNAYDEGFGQSFWAPIFKLWETENSNDAREFLRDNILTPEKTEFQYYMGAPEVDHALVNPMQWKTDFLLNIAGRENQEHQLDLLYDYRNNKEMYPMFQEYFRKSQVPTLAVWGKGDPAFIYPGAEAFKKDLPNAEVHLLDAGHFALETARWEIAKLMLGFLEKIGHDNKGPH